MDWVTVTLTEDRAPCPCPLRAPPVAPASEPRCRGGHSEALSPQGGVPAPAGMAVWTVQAISAH